ncbi:MAG: hypothetical protein L0229_07475 [Blastocatellia bacterium]|nr:hypothetical protein [Blastocatellia bacterium]
MRTIETTATVSDDGKLIVQVSPDISPVEHRVVVVIEEAEKAKQMRLPLNFPVDSCGPWPSNLSLRREDMYDDDGR